MRFKSRTKPQQDKFPYKVTIHESGNRSMVRSDIATITITNADGSEDRPLEDISLGRLTQEQVEPLIVNPKRIDLKKHGKRILKKYKYNGPAKPGRQLLPE